LGNFKEFYLFIIHEISYYGKSIKGYCRNVTTGISRDTT